MIKKLKMTPYQRNHIELLIEQIDAGLLGLYNAHEEGYQFIDFDFLLNDLLSQNGIAEYQSSVEKFLSVFEDLSQVVGSIFFQTTSVDINARKSTVKQIHHRVRIGDVDAVYEEHVSIQDIIENQKSFIDIRIDYTKFDYYIPEREDLPVGLRMRNNYFFKEQGYKKVFNKAPYQQRNSYFTFEVYIKSILNQERWSKEKIK